ncbi:MAG: ABC transporter permease [Pseudomonadota bacterium]
MTRMVISRLLQAIPVLFLVIAVTFFLIRLAPGGPFDNERQLPEQIQQNLLASYNLDAPMHQQFLDYLGNLSKGDFGPSYRYPNRSVTELIRTGLPITLELAFYAIIIALGIGILAGAIAALRPGTLQDYVPMALAMTGICLPAFLLGPLLVLIFGIWLGWLPVSGWGYSPGDKILPSITLGSAYAAYIARLVRGGMLETLSQDYIRTAYAKGLSTTQVVWDHALRGGLIPTIAFLGPALAGLLTGSFVVETIFQIPGLGRFYVQAAFNRDYTMILGTTILLASLIVIMNLLSDLISIWINPKLRDPSRESSNG